MAVVVGAVVLAVVAVAVEAVVEAGARRSRSIDAPKLKSSCL